MKKDINVTAQVGKRKESTLDYFIVKKSRLNDNSDDVNESGEIISKRRIKNVLDSSDSSCDEDSNLSEEQNKVLQFLNTASFADLSVISGCSETKADSIISSRPFRNFDDLKSKKISQKIIDGCQEIFDIKDNLNTLLKKCENLANKLSVKIKPFIDKVELNETGEAIIANLKQPSNLTSNQQLKFYQIIGINWLCAINDEGLNAILADEMGLGKTVQAISFLSYLKDIGNNGPHIIIVPTSTLENWKRELAVWCSNLIVITYYGNQDERRQLRYEINSGHIKFHILLTTYNISVSNKDDRIFIKKIKFFCGIFDEAHMLKNMMSVRYRYMSNFKITRKIMLTGTPLQNNLIELISLLSFVMPDMFRSGNDGLKKVFQISQKTNPNESVFQEEKIRQVKEMLMPFCLRRVKSQVLTQLPKKTVDIVYLPLTKEQEKFYRQVIEKTKVEQSQTNDDTKFDLAKVMELRKISNHTLLSRNHFSDHILRKMSTDMLLDIDHITCDPDLIFDDFSVMNDFQIHQHCLLYEHAIGRYKLCNDLLLHSNKVQYLDENLPKLIANGDKILIFSQFVMVLDILEAFLNYRRLQFLRLDGSTLTEDRQLYIDRFNEDNDVKIFILTTRAGGLGINLSSANVVILFDIDYNPYNDKQAEDRSHRLGQLREVRVLKLISQGTIDECILRIASEKLKLEQITGHIDIDDDNDDDNESNSSSDDKDVDFTSLLQQAIEM